MTKRTQICYSNVTRFVQKDNEGRFLHVQIDIEGVTYNFVNIYAPNNRIERAEFFRKISDSLKEYENVICSGDFNCTLTDIDRCGKTQHSQDSSFHELKRLIFENNLLVIFRSRYPNKKVVSFKRVCNDYVQQSRIDNILKRYMTTVLWTSWSRFKYLRGLLNSRRMIDNSNCEIVIKYNLLNKIQNRPVKINKSSGYIN